MMLPKPYSEQMTNSSRTNLNKPLKFTLENEEIILHISSDIKTALQQQVEISRRQTELMQEVSSMIMDMAAALIHLADKFPEISDK